MPKCSVIIPNYNHANYLAQRINSILSQTYNNYELIILDDGSKDESLAVIEKYKTHAKVAHIIVNETNSGSPFHQWTKGITLASGEWIWIAESDDYAEPDFLETAFATIAKCPEAGIFYSDSIYNTDDGTPYRFKNSASFKNDYFQTKKWSDDYCITGTEELNYFLKYICTIINASCTVIRKDKLLNIINNLKDFRYHGDWYCFIAIALNTNICYSSKPLNSCRMHQENFLNNIQKSQSKKEYFRILNLLVKNDVITDKRKLIDFFTLQFLGFGMIKDGSVHAVKIFRSYFSINRRLAFKVSAMLLWQKITFRKRKTIY